MNVGVVELGEYDNNGEFVPRVWWFGGGIDLTPSILYVEDARSFHQVQKRYRSCSRVQGGSSSHIHVHDSLMFGFRECL